MLLTKEYQGDFLGFTFNNQHSSDFKILRTSSGARFEKPLLPPQQESTVEMPGVDGIHFFKSNFQPFSINVPFAFVAITEKELRAITDWLGTKQLHGLILDEHPYKEYQAKVQEPPQFNYIPFDINGVRTYKGEGNIQFRVFSPYAKAPFKTLGQYRNAKSMKQWAYVSGIKSSLKDFDSFVENKAVLYNPGDIATPLTIFGIKITSPSGYIDIKYEEEKESGINTTLTRMILDANKLPINQFIQINSSNKLIEGLSDSGGIDGTIYNYAIIAGDFIQVEPSKGKKHIVTITTTADLTYLAKNEFHLTYDYLYR